MEILDQETRLLDGSSRKVFSRECVNGITYYNCKVCRVAGLPGINNLQIHVNGKKHKRNKLHQQTAENFDLPFKSSEYVQIPNSELTIPEPIEKPIIASKNTNSLSTSSVRDATTSGQSERHPKEKLEKKISDVLINYKKYRADPESHPLYSEEWESFWKGRYRKLKIEGVVNADTYDYKPDWIKFWTARLVDLEKNELQKLENLFKTMRRSPKRSSADLSSSSDEYWEDRDFVKKRLLSLDYYNRSSHRSFSHRSEPKKPEVHSSERISNESVTVITVCRLLLALESDLGLLAQKVLRLLSTAIGFEGQQINSSDTIILADFESVVLLQTVREKLKGLLMLNLLAPKKMLIVKKSIQNIAILVHQVNSKPQAIEPNAELATKISKALVLSGKENCTEQELETLTSAYLPPLVVEQKPETFESTTEVKGSCSIEGLSEDEFKHLLMNFTELTVREQCHIMSSLKTLENNDPSSADKFRNFMTSENSNFSAMTQD